MKYATMTVCTALLAFLAGCRSDLAGGGDTTGNGAGTASTSSSSSSGGGSTSGGSSSSGGGGSSSGGGSASACSGMSSGAAADLNGFRLFASGSAWNQDVSALPADSQSDAYIAAIGAGTALHPDFGTQYGIPYLVVDSSTQPQAQINLGMYGSESDPGPFAIPANAPIETTSSDAHVLALDRATCWLYEIYVADVNAQGHWSGDSTALWDMLNNASQSRPYGWTSADAAGLPIFAGLVREDEVARGSIDHALRFTVANTRKAYVAPASHWASSSTSTTRLPMGARLRLKASVDISGFSAANQVILRALKKYGMILADNGSNLFITGANDPDWDDNDLNALKRLTAANFEVVQMGTVVTPGSEPQGAVPSIASFSASPAAVSAGGAVTLSFSVSGASYLIISPEVGPVRGTSASVHPTATKTYTLYATNAYGRSEATVRVTVN